MKNKERIDMLCGIDVKMETYATHILCWYQGRMKPSIRYKVGGFQ